MKKALLLAGTLIFIFSMLLAFLYWQQEKIIFFPVKLDHNQAFSFRAAYMEEYISLKNGDEINYLIFPVDDPRGVILYFHGNAGAMDTWGQVAADLAYKTQREIWIMDYPGFGKSTGELAPNEKVLLEMGDALVDKIKLQHPDLPLFLFGRSLGSGIASGVAKENSNKISGLILETPYTSLKSLAHRIYPFVPPFLVNYDLNSTQLIGSDIHNILIIHGTEDQVIPYEQSEELARDLKFQAQLVTIEGGNHNNLSEFTRYWTRLGTYFVGK
jgi:uncharacterized protein